MAALSLKYNLQRFGVLRPTPIEAPMNRVLAKREARLVLIAVALVPATMYAVLGSYSRLVWDDFIHIYRGLELGPWRNMLHWREIWNGSYTYYFVHGLLAPLDTLAPSISVALIVSIWALGATWLSYQLLGLLRVQRHRLSIAISLAALSVSASTNAFYSAQSIYWFSASLRYTLPLAIFLVFLALVIFVAKRPRSNSQNALSMALAVAFCFVSAGFAETYLVFQLTLLTTLVAIVYVFTMGDMSRRVLALLGGGWTGTMASLLAQWTAPGRALRTEVKLQYEWFEPVRHLPDLASITLDYMVELALQPKTVAGFALLFALGMFFSLGGRLRAIPVKLPDWRMPGGGALPYIVGLITQLVFLPVIWTHSSNDGYFLGRFSLTFFSVVVVNIALIGGFMLLAWRCGREQLISREESWRRRPTYVLLLLFGGLAMLAAPQLRSMHIRAEYFLLFTGFSLLVVAWWEWASALTDPMDRWLSLLAPAATMATVLIFSAVVSVGQFFIGELALRSLSSTSFLLVTLGLMWGAAIGQTIRRLRESDREILRWVCAAAIVLTSVSIFVVQLRLLPQFATFAAEWDERHVLLTELRESGQRSVSVPPQAFDLREFMMSGTIVPDAGYADPSYDMMFQYYGFDSITLAGDG